MPALQFTSDLAAKIRTGNKSQTLRAKLPGNCVVGQTLTLLNGYHAASLIGRATISSVDIVHMTDLTHEDAVLDGFATLDDLHTRLRAMSAPDRLYRIRWIDLNLAPAVAPPSDARVSGRRTRKQRLDDHRPSTNASAAAAR